MCVPSLPSVRMYYVANFNEVLAMCIGYQGRGVNVHFVHVGQSNYPGGQNLSQSGQTGHKK